MYQYYDIIIVGGGFYGSMLALHYKKFYDKVVIFEKEDTLIGKASYVNQARVHNGYHYPRSYITALRSHINYQKFLKDFKSAICDEYLMIYAIARNNSKTTAEQFRRFCKQIDIPIKAAPKQITSLFNSNLVEESYLVEESIFDAGKLRSILERKLKEVGVEVRYNEEVKDIIQDNTNLLINTNLHKFSTKQVINSTYSGINILLCNSNLTPLPLKHELTEMPVIKVPDELKKVGVTIMDGPYFGIMPFPDKQAHTLHHVRYTPQVTWFDTKTGLKKHSKYEKRLPRSKYIYMFKDAARYIPCMDEAKYIESLWQIRTVLIKSENSDGRPILYKKDYNLKNLSIIMGGKIDNIYDILQGLSNVSPNL